MLKTANVWWNKLFSNSQFNPKKYHAILFKIIYNVMKQYKYSETRLRYESRDLGNFIS